MASLISDRNFDIRGIWYWNNVDKPKEQSVEISGLLVELNVYHSIETGFATGSLAIADAANFFEKDFNGTGVITVDIFQFAMYESETDETILLKFYITGISTKRQVKEFGHIVVFDLVSDGYFRNQTTRISKRYTGKIEDHISSLLFGKWDKVNPNGIQLDTMRGGDYSLTNPKQFIPATKPKNEYNFISANWRPLKAINFLVEKSIFDNDGEDVVDAFFVERFVDYLFDSFSIRHKEDGNVKFIFQASVADGNTMWASTSDKFAFYTMLDFHFTSDVDLMRAFDEGLLTSTTHRYNILRKKWQMDEISYSDAFISKGYGSKMFHAFKDVDPLNNATTAYSKSKLFATAYTEFFNDPKSEATPYDVIAKRNMFLASINQIKLDFAIPGFSHAKVGEPIGIIIPTQGVTEKNGSMGDAKTYVDETYSGKYFITSINYRFNRNNAVTTIQCAKPELNGNIEAFLNAIGATNK